MAIIFIYNDTLFVHFRVSFLYVMTSSLIYIVYGLQWSFVAFCIVYYFQFFYSNVLWSTIYKPTYTIDSVVTMYISPRKTHTRTRQTPRL